jgi:MFS family permease
LSWDLTHQTSWVGVISMAQLLPLVGFGPLFGALLDRHDHRRFALSVNLALALLSAALYLLTAAHAMRIGLLGAMAVLLGIANSAYHAVRLTMVNDIVPPEQRQSAIAMNSIMFNVTRAVGPAMAGVIIARFGVAASFATNAFSFIAILCALLVVRLKPRQMQHTRHGLLAESVAGLRYIAQHGELGQLLLLSAVIATLGRGIIELLPAFAAAVFGRGSLGLAQLTTAAGIGAIAGALVLSWARSGDRLVRLTRTTALSQGGVICAFGWCTNYWAGLVLTGVLGFTVVLCTVGLQVRLQSCLDDHYRGRVLGVWAAVNLAGPGMGAALAGWVAQHVGLQPVTVAAGILCALLVTWLTLRPQP